MQSVALRLGGEREAEIEAFKAQEYWGIDADLAAKAGNFTARLTHLDGKKLEKLSLGNQGDADRAVAAIQAQTFSVGSVESKPVRRNPWPPFITSTLQQEASRKLGFSAKRTMQVAQGLYEGADIGGETVGLITYMRTDGVTMAPEAVTEAREVIGTKYGKRYVPASPRVYVSKAKNAQEAHEAVRPTSFARTPEEVAKYLGSDEARLYELVWKRAVASQMESAEQERTTVDVVSADKQITLRATGTVTLFDGFLTLYQESTDETSDEDSAKLPKVVAGDATKVEKIIPEQHFTEPPPRYSEASLVRKMEELGIGRPSTYASILSTLRDRAYVKMDRNRFIPEDKGRLVTTFLASFFKRYVEYDFTADLEEKLDEVSAGDLDWKQLLRDFWKDFSAAVGETKDLKISQVIDELDHVLGPHIFPQGEDGTDPRKCPACESGRLNLKLGRFGAFVGCSNYPECKFTRQIGAKPGEGDAGPVELGVFPGTEDKVTLRAGRFGPYVQLGEGEKPKRSGIPKGTDKSDVDLAMAVKLLSLPREVGLHPEDGKPITANFGRFGPYVAPCRCLCLAGVAGGCVHHRPQPCGHPHRREEGQGWRPPRRGDSERPRCRSGGQADQGAEGPLWTLCERRRNQRHHSRGYRSAERDPGTGADPDRRARSQGRQEEKETRESGEGACEGGQTQNRKGQWRAEGARYGQDNNNQTKESGAEEGGQGQSQSKGSPQGKDPGAGKRIEIENNETNEKHARPRQGARARTPVGKSRRPPSAISQKSWALKARTASPSSGC